MVTLSDPILKRLVEVNPAPDDFELPPISDVALFESIVERARSEELWFRPVRVRSWRPGVVVAAAAFVAVLVVAGVLGLLSGLFSEQEGPVVTEPPTVTTVAPTPTTIPPIVTTVAPTPTTVPRYEVTISDLDDGSFTASGSAVNAGVVCGEGTINTITISERAFTDGGDHYDRTEERTLRCTDGSGAIVVGLWIYESQLLQTGYDFFGNWIVVSGTGDYERVTGSGDLDGNCDPDRVDCSLEYTGRTELHRDLGPATPIVAPTGRDEVEITYEGGFTSGLFAATGPAVDAGLFCSSGLIGRVCAEVETGNSVRRCEDTFFCADGTGWITVGSTASQSIAEAPTIRSRGNWTVLSGSATYELATGSGTISSISYNDGHRTTWTFTGLLEVSG